MTERLNTEGLNLSNYVDSTLLAIMKARIGRENIKPKSELQTLLEMWELENYLDLRQIIKDVLLQLKISEITERKDKIKFLSNFVLNYHAEKKIENIELKSSELIKYTLVCQVILYKYYKQVPELKTIREFGIITDFLEIYKMLLTEELKCEQNRRNIRFDFQICIPDSTNDKSKNPNKLSIKVPNLQDFEELYRLQIVKFLHDFWYKYNNFFVKFSNLFCDLKK